MEPLYIPEEIEIADAIGCGLRLARELLRLAGGDVDRVITCSRKAGGLDQCKVLIIDDRLSVIEDELFYEEEE